MLTAKIFKGAGGAGLQISIDCLLYSLKKITGIHQSISSTQTSVLRAVLRGQKLKTNGKNRIASCRNALPAVNALLKVKCTIKSRNSTNKTGSSVIPTLTSALRVVLKGLH